MLEGIQNVLAVVSDLGIEHYALEEEECWEYLEHLEYKRFEVEVEVELVVEEQLQEAEQVEERL